VADRCAMRRIRLARSAIDSGRLDEHDKEFARRAADILSTLLSVRLAPGIRRLLSRLATHTCIRPLGSLR
jgi:hypothetical protein